MAKVVLAYSGGLDTSVCVPWLKKEKGLEVITFTADLGQGEVLSGIPDRAKSSGASKAYVVDLRERFVTEFCFRALKADARYQNDYYMATALGRPLIAAELVRIGREENAEFIAHACTGKGNDQVRFESTVAALAPDMKVIAPLREWSMKSREEEIDYAEKCGVYVPVTKSSPYSIDRNLWGMSIECGVLEDPWNAPPEDAYQMTTDPRKAPDEPEEIVISFENGVPVALDGKALEPVELVERLNEIAGAHGVGRSDMVEDRLVGIKSREIYEAPAASVLHLAHRALEALTLSRDIVQTKAPLSQRYAELVYTGLWYSGLREALDAFFDAIQENVVGDVRVRLYKGQAVVVGRKSPKSLYSQKLATYTAEDVFDHKASEGFIHIWSLPLRAEGRRRQETT